MTEETLFHEARLRDPAERAAFLDTNCTDPEMRHRVEGLLKAHDAAGGVLDQSPATGAYTLQPGARDVPAAGSEQPGERIGPYKLLQKLGEGGMGSVWVAEQSEPVKRRVALKLIKAGMDSNQVLRRFEAERQALALMDHQHIAKVLDAGTTPQGRPYFAMELIKGIPITKYCDQEHLSPRERLELFIPVCQAVQHAHQKGVIHRDLKPSNVLIALYDGKAVPKVIDFGVAKATSQKLTERTMYTEVGQIVGTLEYMAPEQAELNNLDIDTRADIYSLGVILYELLAGSPPFTAKQLRGAAFSEMLRMIREVEPPKPSTKLSSSEELPAIAANRKLEPNRLTRQVHGDLDWIVMKALEKDRGRRYETANGFAMDIQRYLADEPVLAGPPGAGYRLRKLVRRNKGPVLAATGVLMTMVAGVAAVVVVQANANRELAGKNAELAAKNSELADEQAKVQARFELAQKAIETFHTGVSEDMLLKNDQFKDLRNKLLKEAARFYGQLEGLLQGQTDVRSRRALAAGYFQLAELTEKIGSQPEALAVHRKALAVRRELAGGSDRDSAAPADVGRSLIAVGKLLRETGKTDEARAAYEEVRAFLGGRANSRAEGDEFRGVVAESFYHTGWLLYSTGKLNEALLAYKEAQALEEKLIESQSDVVNYQKILSWCYNDTGIVLKVLGKSAEALTAYEKSGQFKRKIAEKHPDVAEFWRDLSISHRNIASLMAQTGKPTEAVVEYEKARAILLKLTEANPAVTQFQSDLASTHQSIAALLSATGKSAEALAAFEQSRTIFQKLADANPAVTQFQSSLAWSHNNIAALLSATGRSAEALAAHEQSRSIRQKLADAYPAVPQFQSELAWSHNNIAFVLTQTGKPVESLAEHVKARAIRQKLVEDNPTVPGYQSDLAWSQHSIAFRLWLAGKPTEALAVWENAQAILLKLADTNPTVTNNQSELARCYSNIGSVLWETGKSAAALAAFEKACDIRQKLADANPSVTRFQRDLAWSHNAIGGALAQSGKSREALAAYSLALAICQKLVDANPNIGDFRRGLGESHSNIGRLHAKEKRFDEAFASLDLGLSLRQKLAHEHPFNSEYARDLADSYASRGWSRVRAKQPAEAATDLRQALEIWAKNADTPMEIWVESSRALALLAGLSSHAESRVSAAEAKVHSDQAVALLAKAVKAGWARPDELKKADFDAVRDSDDFKKLLADLEVKANSGAK
jgi:serine/threonine protein kinase/tetratricopeptide (TPR) repeat protein